MTIWEYLVVEYTVNIWSADLDAYGDDGWELVAIYENPIARGIRVVFKKPKVKS